MTDIVSFEPASESVSTESIDPATLAERSGVEYCEETFTHEERAHCEAGAAGRAIVGVTNRSGELLLWVDGDGHAILPNVVVDPDADWWAVAREDVTATTSLAVEFEGVERVRAVDHEVETDTGTTHLETTHHVVFRASPAPATGDRVALDGDTCDETWTAGWYDHAPVDLDAAGDDSVAADVRLFLD